MMNTNFVDETLNYLCNELGGDWLLTGGSLVKLLFDQARVTEDIDLVNIRHSQPTDEKNLDLLFRWLIEKGSGPEWVNSAVQPFVKEIPNWNQEIILLRSGTKGKIYRPNITFFTYLKLRRGTKLDMNDLIHAFEKCTESFSEKKFLTWAKPEMLPKFKALVELRSKQPK
jgi:hypothetical protein